MRADGDIEAGTFLLGIRFACITYSIYSGLLQPSPAQSRSTIDPPAGYKIYPEERLCEGSGLIPANTPTCMYGFFCL
jgi:hypothetical protein